MRIVLVNIGDVIIALKIMAEIQNIGYFSPNADII
jgi:hypothetical protein